MTATTPTNTINLSMVPHPFAVERINAQICAGRTIAEIIEDFYPESELAIFAHVYLNGDYVPQDKWHRIRPKPDTVLTIRMVPMGGGGGGKNPIRTVLSLAIATGTAAITGGLSTALSGASFLGLNVANIAAGGVNLLGQLALNALAPPPSPRFSANKESPTLFIQGARNQASPFGRVPKVLGKHRFVPPFGALPYTEAIGNDQYIRMLFVWGYGPLEISDLKIGETPISEFEGVEIETRQGYDNDDPITLYSNSVLQNDLQVKLTSAGGYVTRTSEADADELSVDITLPRGLVRFDSRGNKTNTSVSVEVQYAPTGTSNWSAGVDSYLAVSAQQVDSITKPAAYIYNSTSYEVKRIDRIVMDKASGTVSYIKGPIFREGIDAGSPEVPAMPDGKYALAKIERRSSDADVIPSARITDERNTSLVGTNFENSTDFEVTANASDDTVDIAAGGLKLTAFNLRAKQSSALRKSINFKVPAGQYDVRVRRVTADSVDDDTFDEVLWTALRTIRYEDPINMDNLAVTALRIKATDQLNGVIDRFNGIVHSILPDWNGSAWVDQVTSNPASIFRHVLQGNANARPLEDTRLDMDKIEAWHDSCATNGREFNAVIDYNVSVREVLQDVAATGRASPSLIDGKWAVIEDKTQSVPIQHFTPRNTFGFRGNRAFSDLPHGLRVRFINRNKGWIQDERLVFDGTYTQETASKYETLEMIGTTDPDQVWKDGRYHMATARLRPENYSFYTDVEHIVCTRGDLIRFTHDVPMFGLMSGRVKSLTTDSGNTTAVTMDAAMTMEAGKSYALRFRKSDGSTVVTPIITEAGSQTTLTFTTPIATSAGPATGDLGMFGESGEESVALVVKSIEPQNDLNARITCVAYDEDIFAADSETIPDFTSYVSTPNTLQRVPTPVLESIQSGLETVVKHADGSITSRIVVTLVPSIFSTTLSINAKIKAAGETNYRNATVMHRTSSDISITDVEEGETYDIQLRYVDNTGAMSAPLTLSNHRVEGTSALPTDVSSFAMNILGDTAHLSWDPVTDIDLSHYTLRFTPQTSNATWGSSVDLVSQIAKDATSIAVPAAVGTYLIKAVDIGGRESEGAPSLISTIAGLNTLNVVETLTEDTSFTGNKTNLVVNTGVLTLIGADSIDDWSEIDDVGNIDIGEDGVEPSGTYEFTNSVDLGSVYTSRLTADMDVLGSDVYDIVDIFTSVDSIESWDQSIDPSLFNVKLQLRTTDDDPTGSPTWSSWGNFVVGDYSARAYEFRTVLESYSPEVAPQVSRLRVNVDMPDRTDAQNDLSSDAAGSTINFTSAFKAIPAVNVTAQDMATGDYYTITNITASSFDIRFFNSGGTGISRTFDYLAKGYGKTS